MKLILSTLCLVLCLSLATSFSRTWGRRNHGDSLLMQEQIVRMPKSNNFWSLTINFPKHGEENFKKISAIDVFDHFSNSSGAIPSKLYGGPRRNYVSINLKSQDGRGINSTVQIWGK